MELWKVLLALGMASAVGFLGLSPEGSPPEITFIDFPTQIEANGEPVTGYLFFEDPDGDVAWVKFELLAGDKEDLQLSPAWEFDPQVQGQTEGVIEFQIAATAPGDFRLEVTLKDEVGNISEPVELAFEALSVEPPPILEVSPSELEFRAQEGDPDPLPATLTITNAGGGSLSWQAEADVDWILLGATGGSLAAEQSTELLVFVKLSGLTAGTHRGMITISAPQAQGSPAHVSVTLTIEAAAPALQVSPISLSFRAQEGGAAPASQSLRVSNGGGGVLEWQATADVAWIEFRPTQGTITTGSTTVHVSVSVGGLTAGTYQGTITFTAEGAKNSPQRVSVTLQITSPTAHCGSIIFSDDFSDRNSGWFIGDFQGASWGYAEDGQYRVLTKWDHMIAWSWAPISGLSGNFCLEVDVKQLVRGALSDLGMLGVIFAGKPEARSFTFFGILNPLGAYVVGRLSGQVQYLHGPVISEAIKPVNQVNRLLIIARGSQADFYINGKKVATLSLSTAGAVGVFVATFDYPNVNGRFDNFVIREFR
jgi:hypothetical protein